MANNKSRKEQKDVFVMKKRVLSVFLTIELVICAVATLSACGIKLKDREITPTIEEIWQSHTGEVYVEVGNLGDYLQDKDAAQQLEFSVNGGNWYICFYNNSIETMPGNGIYNILYSFYEEEDTNIYTNITKYSTGDPCARLKITTTRQASHPSKRLTL